MLRLVLSLAGLPNSTVKLLSLTVVFFVSALYYGSRVYQSGFGSYKHILPLLVIQSGTAQLVVIAGILISAATGQPEHLQRPRIRRPDEPARHITGHLVFGFVIGPLVLWAIASLVMWITKKVSGPRPAVA